MRQIREARCDVSFIDGTGGGNTEVLNGLGNVEAVRGVLLRRKYVGPIHVLVDPRRVLCQPLRLLLLRVH